MWSTLLVAAGLCLSARADLIQPGLQALTWKFNGTDFWSPVHLDSALYHVQSPSGSLPASLNRRDLPSGGYLPCTVVSLNASVTTLSAAVVEDIITSYGIDDVWSAEQFMQCLYVQHPASAGEITVDPSFSAFLQKHGVTTAFTSVAFDLADLKMPSEVSLISVASPCDKKNGPYVAILPDCDDDGLAFAPVYALHPDTYEAFMVGSLPDPAVSDSHQQLQVSLPGSRLPNIIVPSKLGLTNAGAGPLAGLRFAVKDIFHVKGLKTSGGSRAYYQIYDYQNYTTETVDITLHAGAELIGKTKTIAFALGAPRNGQEIDYQDPWSSRGDGYQNTGGSSSGSGAAVAAYDWVDFAIGSDTGGSVRFPARYGGFYGYKPTHGVYNITGILVAIAAQDTPGHMARSPEIFTRVGRVWTAGRSLPSTPVALPKRMLRYIDQPTNVTQVDAAELIESFFDKVAKELELETTGINMTESFLEANISQTSPPQSMPEWMATIYSDQNDVEGWDKIGKDMVDRYGKIPNQEGAWPPVDPPVNASWWNGINETIRARYPESQQKRIAFASFFNEAVLPANNETCSEHIFAHTYHTPPDLVKVSGQPLGPRNPLGWYDGVYTNYAGTPEIVVPIGQVEYWSPYTRRSEWQPVTVALGMAKGCDNALFELVDRLASAGLLTETLPGKVAYPV